MNSQTATVEFLYSAFGDDPDLADLVEMYVQELPQRLQALHEAADQKNWPELTRLSHQMKGAAGSYGFHQITPYAKHLELTARAGEGNEAHILEALQALIDVCCRCQSGRPA